MSQHFRRLKTLEEIMEESKWKAPGLLAFFLSIVPLTSSGSGHCRLVIGAIIHHQEGHDVRLVVFRRWIPNKPSLANFFFCWPTTTMPLHFLSNSHELVMNAFPWTESRWTRELVCLLFDPFGLRPVVHSVVFCQRNVFRFFTHKV